jgi:hypothetical protein
MSYFKMNTDDVPSHGGNNNQNERRQNNTNAARHSNKFLTQITAIKSEHTKKPSPFGMARDLQEQDKDSSSRRPSSAERSSGGGGRLTYSVFNAAKEGLPKALSKWEKRLWNPS